jgi:uncharacterized oxidoreductase
MSKEEGGTVELKANTMLITGGATGIGFALAERFLKAGSEVVICGRRKDRLLEAKKKYPRMHIRPYDLSEESERVSLCEWVIKEFPRLNVLVNNAGIQRRLRLAEKENWEQTRQEIAINLEAPVHLSGLFIPQLLKQPRPVIINVTSGLAFSPLAQTPVYCATKAALRSFTLSLRHQLSKTPIEVIEVIPPAVNTDLGGVGLHAFGVPVDEFADAVIKQLESGEVEIAYGFSEKARRASREELDAIFQQMNQSTHR